MGIRESLLALERLDLEADGLREERATLPEIAALAENAAALEALPAQRADREAQRATLAAEERRLESEAGAFAERARQVEEELYSGRVTAPRELEALQAELQGFEGKRAALEEEQLGVMEQGEGVEGELQEIESRQRTLESEGAQLRAARADAEARIDEALARIAGDRSAVEPELPASYLEAYGRARKVERLKGRVTAVFEAGQCGGCRVALPIMEATRVQREDPDVAVPCPRCQRIFLR